jgi:hypothetical protein
VPDSTATPLSHAIELRVTGHPDVPNKHGSGHIRPTDVDIRYRDGSIRANLYGRWVREDGELTDAPISQNYAAYKGDTADWPDWLAELARKNAPKEQPADQAALRERITDALLTTRRTDWEGKADHRNHRYDARCALCAYDVDALADAVLAVLPVPTDRAAVLTEAAEAAFALDFDVLRATTQFDSHRQAWELGTVDAAEKLRRMAAEAQPAEVRCTCADAGGCFAPAGHYADCPAAEARQPGEV